MEQPMTGRTGTSVSLFLVGLGIGSLAGVLFAPKSGKHTRDYLARKTKEGAEHARNGVRELREHAEVLVGRGKKFAEQQKESVVEAVAAGRRGYREAMDGGNQDARPDAHLH